jgi:hypothetical protein
VGPIRIVLAALFLATPALCAEKGSDLLKRSQEDLTAGRFSKLDREYEAFLKGGTRERVLSLLTFRVLGRPANIPQLEKWTKSRPKSPSAWASLGLAHLEQAKEIRKTAPRSKEFKETYLKAETYCDKAFDLSPKDINLSSFQIECRKVGGWRRTIRKDIPSAKTRTP